MSPKTANSSSSSGPPPPPPPPPLDRRALFYMGLLAIQFGIQPILTRQYTTPGVTRSTVILVQEVTKFFIAFGMLRLSGGMKAAIQDWSIETWLSVALVPAALYAIQNIAALTAYQNLDALTFNVLNQTKTLSAAVCLYFVMGRRQSVLQAVSLMMLLVAALVMEGIIRADVALALAKLDLKTVRKLLAEIEDEEDAGDYDDDDDNVGDDSSSWDARHFTHGVCPIMLASFISGLAGALSQKNLQQMGRSGTNSGGRNPYLFSMELCLASTLVLLLSLLVSSDGKAIMEHGFWKDWTLQTLIPIATNSVGGILVGLVTKYAGSVRKGFALILGIFLSGVLQALLQSEKGVRPEQVVGGLLAGIALYIHATNPPRRTGATPASTPAASPSKPLKQD